MNDYSVVEAAEAEIEIVHTIVGGDFCCIKCDFVDVMVFGEGLQVRLAMGLKGVIDTGLFARLDFDQLVILRDALDKIAQAFEPFAAAADADASDLPLLN